MRRVTRRGFLATIGATVAAVGLGVGPGSRVGAGEPPADGEAPLATIAASTQALDFSQISNLTVRVTLSTSQFTSLDHTDAQVTANGTYRIVNAFNNAVLASGIPAGTVYIISNPSGYLRVQQSGAPGPIGSFTGPILVQPDDHSREAQLRSVDRGSPYGNPYYRGYLEIKQSSVAGKVRVVNVLEASWLADPLEKYLYGVVPMEMPVDYGLEALKAQAVAARTYAASKHNGSYVDVTDSTSTQVYYGYAAESTNSTLAVDGTRGVVATYNGSVISALYSACCGGHTEHNDNVYFSRVSAGSPAAYLRGVRCYEKSSCDPDLTSETGAQTFWGGNPAAYCDWSSGLYRWAGWTWGRIDLESILNRYLPDVPSNYISQPYLSGSLGELRDLTVLERGVSGKIKRFRVKNSAGTYWDVYSDYYTRYVLRTALNYGLQFSSNMVFYPAYSGETLISITVKGGGWGHGVGLCQRGARGMATAGKSYTDILTHYYSGISFAGRSPLAPTTLSTLGGPALKDAEPVVLAWIGTATSYQMEIRKDDAHYKTTDWLVGRTVNLGVLPRGTYRWRVHGKNNDGIGDFSAWQTFSVASQVYHDYLPLIRNCS
ncbi:MAG: SpoIID/LytB domain-containing protein [Chloroflexota bacterium]